MTKIKVAVLDDYQNVTNNFANWETLSKKIVLKVFNEYIGDDPHLSKKLFEYDVLCLMRERTPLPGELIHKLPNLKLVITSGMWNASVDSETLKKKNITYCGTDTQIHPTAELTWALIMNVWRGIQTEIQNMRDGKWQTTIGRCLKGNTLGIFGLGKQGSQIANFAKAFGMKVIAWSHNLKPETCNNLNIEYVSSRELFSRSDILTIHTRLSERTHGYINSKKIETMKKDSILINTSRGPIIKEEDLIDALNNKIISGAALDVFDKEPLPNNHALRKLKNVILTPHIGYVSEETYSKFFNGYLMVIKSFIDDNTVNLIE